MFKKKPIAVIALASLLLVGCGKTPTSSSSGTTSQSEAPTGKVNVKIEGDSVTSTLDADFHPGATEKKMRLTVWSEVEAHPLFKQVIAKFVEDYAYDSTSNTKYAFTVTIGDEFAAAATSITQDIEVAPDVFGFPDDQLEILVTAGAIQEVTGASKTLVTNANTEASIASATLNNKLYAYPQTADNGYFLYYNKSVLDAEDVESFDGIIAALTAHSATRTDGLKTKIIFPFEDAWYIPSFFFGSGSIAYDPVTKTMTTDFDNEAGKNAARGLEKIHTTGKEYIKISDVNGNDALFSNKDAGGATIVPEAVAGVTGTWNAQKLSAAMGDGYAATKLPTFTPYDAGGVALPQQQMGSFAGSKLIGIKAQSDPDKLFFSDLLAKTLTSKETQVKRFQEQGYGPSNIEAQQDPAVKADVALTALNLQAPFAVSQSRSVGNKFWDPTAAFGRSVAAQDYGEGLTLIDALEAWASALRA